MLIEIEGETDEAACFIIKDGSMRLAKGLTLKVDGNFNGSVFKFED